MAQATPADASRTLHFHVAYGLEIASEIPLPALSSGGEGRDVVIRRAATVDAPRDVFGPGVRFLEDERGLYVHDD